MSKRMAGNFRKGADAAENASKGAQFAKTHYFGIEDGKSAILRFLTDEPDWIVVDQHNNIATKGAPAGHDGNWPARMGAVCRRDVAFAGQYADCYICDNYLNKKGKPERPTGRTWALACLREEVIEDGKVVGIRDQTREVAAVDESGKPTGETTTERAVVVVNMGYKNFFSALTGFAGHFKTALDRDYLIKRKGSDETTTYQVIPLDPITMPDGSIFDTRNPEHAAKYGIKPGMLEEIVTERSSDEFYARFFDKRVAIPVNDRSGGSSASSAPQQAAAPVPSKPEGNVEQGRLDALQARIKGYGPSDGEANADSTPQQAAAPSGGAPSTAGDKAPVSAGMRAFD